jgi:hypothetical protein
MPFNIIVFSKDRAMQLDLFIRSFNHCVSYAKGYKIDVLYTYSNSKFGDGYNRLIRNCPENIKFTKETDFKKNLLSLVAQDGFTVFFVDDNIFKNPVDFYDGQMDIFINNKSILCRSLRLSRHLTYCYPAKVPMTPPKFDMNGIFRWRYLAGDYGYPFSVDGHIFRTNDILPLIIDLEYSNPNTLEGAMQKYPTNRDYMICYNQSIIINNPINRVQTVNDNIHGNISAEYLNNCYRNGKRIKLEPFLGIDNTSCHTVMEIELEDEGYSN